MEPQKITPPSKPHPPVVGKVTHHSIELYWDLEKKAKRQGPQEQWFRFSIEEEDPKMHSYGIIYTLMLACYAGHLDVVKYLRRHGASWQARDLGGCTALHWAADGGHCSVIEWMIKDGCEVDVVDTGSGWTPLMRVSAVSGNQRVASLLIDAGANVNVKDRNGKTPLMVAVLNNHEELVQLLLDKGADASVKNEFGKGVLEMARVFDRQSVISLLEERKKKQRPKKSCVC
ncbi:fibronectin type 3 and ankyrin repeat domains protein 1 isoform X5 [Macaca fascicularis]|uniref:fibronectin type 3 and ankyrin repeat domains protein 1 isoform X5 n=1 Tax=Macaca fascicularis TaxID=9541 RepID=UPI003D15CA60